MKPLYEITGEYCTLLQEVMNCDDISDEQIELIRQYDGDIKEKIINIGSVIKNFECETENINNAIEKMKERRDRAINKASKLLEYLKTQMQLVDLMEVKSPEFDIKLVKNPCKVDVYDKSILPLDYIREETIRVINKEKIRIELKNNNNVPGAKLEQSTRVRIK